ncbi:MAG: alpha-N-acetylglucosaminidase [Bacteroidales bacterium]|nr:alpha-N-acetylglucosaminidase [Bacteroidales bacterium]
MKKCFLLLFSILVFVSCTRKEPFPSVRQILQRIVPDQERYFLLDSISKENGKDVFEIVSEGNKIRISASSPVVAATAFNYYLKQYCHCFISRSGNNMNMPEKLPAVKERVRITSPFKWRYYFNYCTYSYSMAYWGWDEWQRELDWMAMNGVNMPLAITGTEAVWQNTLKKFGFTDVEIKEFIPGPAYTAWWLMGNIEGWGGPVSQQWIDNRAELQKKILLRMHELGMTPVFQGFYSMVPAKLKEKYPSHHIIDGGDWGGFIRPSTLDPTDSLFSQMAGVYYAEMEKLYGKTLFYGGDPFHEGGNMEGIDITASAKAVQTAMQKAVPGSVWVLQGWWDNPKDGLLEGADTSKTLILDLFAEGRPNWPRRECYSKFPWVWNILQNFGNKTGMYGRLEETCSAPFQAMNSDKGKALTGIGIMAEGTDNNPIIWDALFDMAWKDKSPDIDQWIKDYTYYRYGSRNERAEQAWNILRKTVYRGPINQEGTIDAAVGCRPSLDVSTSWLGGRTKLYYNPLDLQKAWKLLIECSDDLKNIDAFQYDIVDVTRQVLCNSSLTLHKEIVDAYNSKDLKLFEERTASFLQLIDDMDTLLGTRNEFLFGRWVEGFKKIGTSDDEKKLFEFNARRQVTLWGTYKCSIILHEYAMKQWSGLLKDFYYQRWKIYFDALKKQLSGEKTGSIDFYTWEDNWTHQNNLYPATAQGNSVVISKALYKKYFLKEAEKPFVENPLTKENAKLTKDLVVNTLTSAFYNVGKFIFNYDDIIESKVWKEENSEDITEVCIFIKTKPKVGFSGNLQLTFKWNYYEWDLLAIKNIDFKKN